MESVTCFMAVPTTRLRRQLRRFAWSKPGETHYHNKTVDLDVVECAVDEKLFIDDSWPHDDPRWPTTCDCGYQFLETDQWQLFPERIYEGNSKEFVLKDAPAGAMWDVPWFADHWHGPDGRCLCVMTPGGEWVIDGPATGGGFWTRTGDPPKITVRPSIGKPDGSGGFVYHAFMTDGVLVPC